MRYFQIIGYGVDFLLAAYSVFRFCFVLALLDFKLKYRFFGLKQWYWRSKKMMNALFLRVTKYFTLIFYMTSISGIILNSPDMDLADSAERKRYDIHI